VGVGLSCALREEVTGVGDGYKGEQCPYLGADMTKRVSQDRVH
jgi:hypothetical protein